MYDASTEDVHTCRVQNNRHETREKMRINHIAEWYKRLWDNTPRRNGGANKLRTIKYGYKIEPYLCSVRNREHRVAIAKLATLYKLKQDATIDPPIPASCRYCSHCSSKCHYNILVEGELHFMCFCSLYDCARSFLYYCSILCLVYRHHLRSLSSYFVIQIPLSIVV